MSVTRVQGLPTGRAWAKAVYCNLMLESANSPDSRVLSFPRTLQSVLYKLLQSFFCGVFLFAFFSGEFRAHKYNCFPNRMQWERSRNTLLCS
ncbi:hypothetical protein QR680_005405 [Steinernema hermaphroditum]|uniref:Uncharacterized protein n=1 Tax=Steinernema hermaphroditum TaxID=289476 RepID=A0AA39HRX9_9BILA|nr:hypothetical protein QR680_005405 [Steinernema hermaphroditum]